MACAKVGRRAGWLACFGIWLLSSLPGRSAVEAPVTTAPPAAPLATAPAAALPTAQIKSADEGMKLKDYIEAGALVLSAVTLVFLVIQVRDAKKSIRLQTTIQATDKIMKIDELLVERPELAAVFGGDKNLSGKQTDVRRQSFMYLMINYFATLFILREKEYMDEDEWIPYENYFKDVLSHPEFRKLCEQLTPGWYYAPFEKYMNTLRGAAPKQALTRIEIVEVTSAQSPEYAEAMRIYEASFPASEREKTQAIHDRLTRPELTAPDRYHLLVLRSADEEASVQAFAMIHYLRDRNIGFLGYLAVKAESRDRGYGSFLMAEVKKTIERDGREEWSQTPLGIFTELDHEDPDDPSTFARFRFWTRHHMLPLDMHWEYPNLRDGVPAAAMYLAFMPFGDAAAGLDARAAEEATRAIYRGVYRHRHAGVSLERVLTSLLDKRSIGHRIILAPPATVVMPLVDAAVPPAPAGTDSDTANEPASAPRKGA